MQRKYNQQVCVERRSLLYVYVRLHICEQGLEGFTEVSASDYRYKIILT